MGLVIECGIQAVQSMFCVQISLVTQKLLYTVAILPVKRWNTISRLLNSSETPVKHSRDRYCFLQVCCSSSLSMN